MRTPIPYSCPVCASRLPRAAARCFFCEHPLPLHKGPATARAVRAAPRGIDRKPQDLPRLHVAAQDFGQLETLAYVTLDRAAGSNLLRSELDRATICNEESVPKGTVRMGSVVVVQDRGEDGSTLKIRGVLVYPGEQHRTLASIQVSSPLGAALVGLSTGDVMPYEGADGLWHVVTVLSTVEPEPADDPPKQAVGRDEAETDLMTAEDETASRVVAFPSARRLKPTRAVMARPDEPPPAA